MNKYINLKSLLKSISAFGFALSLTSCSQSGSGGHTDSGPDIVLNPPEKYFATFEYPENNLMVGQGTLVVYPSVNSCKDSRGLEVDFNFCVGLELLEPSLTYASPAGTTFIAVLGADTPSGQVEIEIEEGELFSDLDQSLIEQRISLVLTCTSDRYKDNAKCLIACPSGGVAEEDAISATECQAMPGHYADGNGDFVEVLPGYYQPLIGGLPQLCPHDTFQSLPGQTACNTCVNTPSRAVSFEYTSTTGKTSSSCEVAEVTLCEVGFYANDNFCYRVTAFENAVTGPVCSGTSTAPQIVTACEYGDGTPVSAPNMAAHCPQPADAPVGLIESIAGNEQSTITYGERQVTCAQGQTLAEAEADPANILITCDSDATKDGNLCRHKLLTMESGSDHTCAIGQDEGLYCWGGNAHGQLGTGDTVSSAVPVKVSTSHITRHAFKKVSAGSFYTCAIIGNSGSTNQDRFYCWGRNSRGNLGVGDSTNRLRPTAVNDNGALMSYIPRSISAGDTFTCGVAGFGSDPVNDVGFCWGNNFNGQLTQTGTQDRVNPEALTGNLAYQSIKKIVAGYTSACAIAITNRVFCWGEGTDHKLANGGSTTSNPFLINSGSLAGLNIIDVSIGMNATCALASNGTVHCWGQDNTGQLGSTATSTNATTPIAVSTSGVLSGATALSLESHPTGMRFCAVYTNATLAGKNSFTCWGSNNFGENGTGITGRTEIPSTTSEDLAAIDTVKFTTTGSSSCVLSRDGIPYCFGYSQNGSLGGGDTDTYTSIFSKVLSGDLN